MSNLVERFTDDESSHAEPRNHGIAEPGSPDAKSIHPLTRDFLTWLASAPRTYQETMAAWQTHCPRHTVWEDALGADLIRVENGRGQSMGQAQVTLTPRGRAVLHAT